MNILFWGLTIGVLGKLLLGIAVVRVHMIILRERRLDEVVFASIRRERMITLIGILMIVLGYALEIMFYGFTPLLTCEGGACTAALGAIVDAWR